MNAAIATDARQLAGATHAALELMDQLREAVRNVTAMREALRVRVVQATHSHTGSGQLAVVNRLQDSLDRLTDPALRGFELPANKPMSDEDITTTVNAIAAMAQE